MQNQNLKLNRVWAEIDLDKLDYNFAQIKSKTNQKCKIMAIVKADAYGHGDQVIARHLINKVDFFGVSNIEEAISLRNFGINKPILILGYTSPEFVNLLSQYKITQAIFNFEYAKKISAQAFKQKINIDCHIKIDSGMNRIGFSADEANFDDLTNAYKLECLNISGIFTHFCVSDQIDSVSEQFTIKQFEIFKKICDKLLKLGFDIGIRHCCNSAAIFKYPQMHLDMVRAGICLYGSYIEIEDDLKPILTLKSRISMIKNLNSGDTVGYGRKFVAKKPMKVATICAGYADGLNRLLSNQGAVIINNKLAEIIGSICMDQTVVDVSNINEIDEGDEVILWGRPGCDLNTISQKINTIPYELLCNINKRVHRIYIKH